MCYIFILAVAIYSIATRAALQTRANLDTPFHADGRWIRTSKGVNFTYTGINWPGAADTMLPETLQYQPISTMVSKIKSAGFNSIRLTFAVQMIDELYENKMVDISISKSLANALGTQNGSKVLQQILRLNPSFTAKTTRLQVFDAVALECAQQGIYVHLDNHISKAEWCCSFTDGNGWFGAQYFDVGNWTRALSYMASRAKKWPSFVSFGLRNELRPSFDSPGTTLTYNWKTWYDNMIPAAAAVNKANPKALIFLGGINSDLSLDPIPTGASLDLLSGTHFNKSSFAYANKLVLELHKYDNSDPSCDLLKAFEYNSGFDALDSNNKAVKNVMPVVFTEFGYAQDAAGLNTTYAKCIRDYLVQQKAGWLVWNIGGSYYIREGVQNSDEPYGIFNRDLSDYRNRTIFDAGIGAMIKAAKS